MRIVASFPLVALAAGCAPTPPPADLEYSESDRDRKLVCDAQAVQSYVGKKIEGDTGETILLESGSARLRWSPPDSAWTMDYRLDRVNVRYDRAMTITDITCG
ncbi:I78 family peptidase inhibitor [Altererythrobacter sp. GH1-8]|uniref:I78 family peptidase inhibitor n=1 Tax=Altererythrobacter sp. GH1-8 TaxID=3349333 RepID=UPI00374D567C